MKFILNSQREKEVWLAVIGLAAHLEDLAVAILFLREPSESKDFASYERALSLWQAAERLQHEGLLDAAIVKILQDVANLRNSVAHRGAAAGVTLPGDDAERPRGYYKGSHIFGDDPGAFRTLVDDVNAATEAMAVRFRELQQPSRVKGRNQR